MEIILAAALLPAIILMVYVYKHDKIEKEPFRLLLVLFMFGALSCIPAGLLEDFFSGILDSMNLQDTQTYYIIMCFGIVACSEEGLKLFFLKRKTWKCPDFNYTFDGLLYSVCVSLGFAGLENIMYVLDYGFGVVISRGLLSVPGHCTFAIFMGLFYSRAKFYSVYGNKIRAGANKLLSFVVPVLLHGYYDYCLMMPSDTLIYCFFVFVVIVDILSFRVVKKQSGNDTYIA